jgi:hypothetical protein
MIHAIVMGETAWKCREIKVKAIPVQVGTCLEGSRRLRLLDFKTVDTWRW